MIKCKECFTKIDSLEDEMLDGYCLDCYEKYSRYKEIVKNFKKTLDNLN